METLGVIQARCMSPIHLSLAPCQSVSTPTAKRWSSCSKTSLLGGATHPASRSPSRGLRPGHLLQVRAEKEEPGRGKGSTGLKQEGEEREKASRSENGTGAPKNASQLQEADWKNDPDFKRFMGDKSIEAVLKLETKIAEQKLAQLEAKKADDASQNFFQRIVSQATASNLRKQKQRLEAVEGLFRALDLPKLRSAFSFDTFFVRDARRFGDGGIFVGSLRGELQTVRSQLEPRLREAAGRDVDVWYLQEDAGGIMKDVVVVQPKDEINLQLEGSSLSNFTGYTIATLLGISTLGSTLLMSGFFQPYQQTLEEFLTREAELFAGFTAIFLISEVAARWAASKHGVKLSPTILIPSTQVGSLGAVNNIESLLPNRTALFDIAAARSGSALLVSAILISLAYLSDGSFNGGANALYIRPQFFFNNPLLSFIQYATGPYADELGNVLPQAVEGLGVPVDPLAFAGLLGIVISSLNLLPAGRLEGGRIMQALYGRRIAARASTITTIALGVGGLFGSQLALVWALIASFFRGGEEVPAIDEVTKVGRERYILGGILAVICLLALFPNSAGTFPSPFYTPPFFRGDI